MDSLSQLALGAAVSVAVMSRRTTVWKSALWGAVAGTLPDLDVLIDQGDVIRNMVLHRAESHSLFWLTLFSLPLAALVARLHGEWGLVRRWWLALWLVLLTHPLLDAMTIYGTQLALPFSNYPFGVGSMFIIDPLYTLPLLVGVIWVMVTSGSHRGRLANVAGLLLSTAYLAWSFFAQQQVTQIARTSLAQQGIAVEHLLVTPTPFNTLLWRVVAVAGDEYHEGFYSLLDAQPKVAFDRFPRGNALASGLQSIDGVQRLVAFTKGLYKLEQRDSRLLISDLRMGQEPNYSFTFAVAERHSPPVALAKPEQIAASLDIPRSLDWLWRRALGERLACPHQSDLQLGQCRR
jgi:inner membrane protein